MTKIEWTEKTWNPTVGCSRCSTGCDSCYAISVAAREMQPAHVGLTTRASGKVDWTGEVRLLPDRLETPLKWRKDYRVFVDSMSDLFEASVPDDYIDEVFAVMAKTMQQHRRHSFQVLTKRAQRMSRYMNAPDRLERVIDASNRLAGDDRLGSKMYGGSEWLRYGMDVWPLPNVWLGVSVENQQYADLRIPHLLATPAAVRWLSIEPMVGAVDLSRWLGIELMDALGPIGSDEPGWGKEMFAALSGRPEPIDWVVLGGESGQRARPMHIGWARTIREQCLAAEVPLLVKQWGQWREADRADATHLLHVDGRLVPIESATSSIDLGHGHQRHEDLVDRGHPGWMRVRKMSSKATTGRTLDGQVWDQYPTKGDTRGT